MGRFSLVTNEYYHVFNRGVARMPTFIHKADYLQAIRTIPYYCVKHPPMKFSRFKELSTTEQYKVLSMIDLSEKQVQIICFVLMPNHFHFLLKQTAEHGISVFISKFTNSYTKYFNTKNEQVGPLFQGVFKAVHLESDEQLLHLSRYIHLNPLTSNIIKKDHLFSYPWSSLPLYFKSNHSFINPKPIMENFSSYQDYKDFLFDHADFAQRLDELKHLTFE